MSFSIPKRHHSKIGSHLEVTEDIFSLNKHALGPGVLAENARRDAGLAALGVTQPREYRLRIAPVILVV